MMFVKTVIDISSERRIKEMKQTDIIKILVTSAKRQSKDGKRKWKQHRTAMELIVVGEESKGKQKKWVNVNFCGKELSAQAQKDITRGYLYVRVSDLNFPRSYEITKDEDGKDVYPEVKVFGYERFEEQLKEIDNPFVTDESETEETEIEEPSEDSEQDK